MNFFVFLLILSGCLRMSGSLFCPPLNLPNHGTVKCHLKKTPVDCFQPYAGVVAVFRCDEFYKLDGNVDVKCLPTGSWSSTPPTCVLDCGRKSSSVGLVVNGVLAPPGAFPWHVAIYVLTDKKHEYRCGGSLISENAIITAGHCVWRVPTRNLIIVSGKNNREFKSDEKSLQERKATKVEIVSTYQDMEGNYNGDIAVIFTKTPFAVNHVSAPVCFDWDQRLTEKQLSAGTFGVAVGWGLTENETLSDRLRMLKLPVASDEQCINKVEADFKKFITFTSFCAGFANGSGVCNGDSGGGLVFFDQESGRWYIQGLVSVSPRRKGTPFCDPNYYTVFTKVALFSKWLQQVMKTYSTTEITENYQDLYSRVRKYFEKDNQEASGIKSAFPHTKKIACCIDNSVKLLPLKKH